MDYLTPAELAIFARVPVRGQVKTRLEPVLGVEGAYAAHLELVQDCLGRLAHVSGLVTTLWLDGPPNALAQDWSDRFGVALAIQPTGDLGDRMQAALARALSRGRAGLVVGTDCPTIDAAYVRRAIQCLAQHDLVFAPAEDGGYGLVGLAASSQSILSGLFANVRWSTAQALSDTLANVLAGRAQDGSTPVMCSRIALLPTIWDVDQPDDWLRYAALRQQRIGH